MTPGGAQPTIDPDATLFVTRPQPEADHLCATLRALGRTAIAFPVIGIEPIEDATPLAQAMSRLDDYRLVVFVSPNAIRRAFAHRREPWPAGVTIGVMGPGSRAIVEASGAQIVSPPEKSNDDGGERFDSEALLAALEQAIGLAHGYTGRVLLVRGSGGRAWFADRLRSLGVVVDEVAAYRRVLPELGPTAIEPLIRSFVADARVVFIVTSSEGVDNLVTLVRHALEGQSVLEKVDGWLFAGTVLAPHRRIASRARDAGFTRVKLCGTGDSGIVAAIE